MNENLTEIICVQDHSGSMGRVAQPSRAGFNKFLSDQKELEGDALLTLVHFAESHEIVHDGVPIQDVPEMEYYSCGGSTSLLDALGNTIDRVSNRLDNTPFEKRPSKVICLVITDGRENTSKEYTYEQVANMVKAQQDESDWQFVFQGANMDAIAAAGQLGISADNAFNVSLSSAIGTRATYTSSSDMVKNYRISGSIKSK